MTEQAMREAFEDVVLDEFTDPVLHRDSNGYVSYTVAFGYKCWQAALQWAAEGQEPVAWMSLGACTAQPVFCTDEPDDPNVAGWTPLYAAPVPNELQAEVERLRAEVAALRDAVGAATEFIGTVAGGASWWDDVWSAHETAIDNARKA